MKKEKISLIDYFKNINKFVLAVYIITWILFVIEMVFARGTVFLDKPINVLINDIGNLTLPEILSLIFPVVYVIVNLIIIFFKKINWLSIALLLFLLLIYPETLFIILFRLMDLSEGKSF